MGEEPRRRFWCVLGKQPNRFVRKKAQNKGVVIGNFRLPRYNQAVNRKDKERSDLSPGYVRSQESGIREVDNQGTKS